MFFRSVVFRLFLIIDRCHLACIIIVFFILPVCHTARAQSNLNELTVDRPGIAESPFTVAPGMYQFEVGFDYFNRYNGKLYNLPVGLFRTGISEGAELRISTKNLVDQLDGKTYSGVSPLWVGVKVHIIHQHEWIPETDILTNLIIPLSTASVQPINLGHEVYLLFQNDFYPRSAINYNIGYIWDGNQQRGLFSGSFCYNYLPTEKMGLFLEYFSYVLFNQWPGEQGADGGMTYLIKPRLQLDLSAGISSFQKQNNFFISSGFSVRLERKKGKRILGHANNQKFSRQRSWSSL